MSRSPFLRPAALAAAIAITWAGSAAAAAEPAAAPALAKTAPEGGAKPIPATLPEDAIPSYRRVDDRLATGGQPSPEALSELKAMGFKTVISLRTAAEGPEEEEGAVTGQGLAFVRVPVTPETFSSADVDAVSRVLDDPARAPVLLHCAGSPRTAAVLAVLEARKGKSSAEAIAAGKKLGLARTALIEATERVIAAEKD